MEGAFLHRGRPVREAAVPGLVEALLEAAGLSGAWAVESVPTVGWVNATTIIRRHDGSRVVVRRYGWPFDDPDPFDRRAKEAALHPQLIAAGVPVAKILAVADFGGERAALLSYLPGELLGVVAARVPAAELEGAWREAGAALRAAHGVPPPPGGSGFVTAGTTAEFPEGSFGAHQRARIGRFAERLARGLPELRLPVDRIADLAERGERTVDSTPDCFGHSDANAWNVMVARDRFGRWGLSGWLDWELAWVADPAWDHMRMTVQRYADIGPTPAAWWQGYGSQPPAANLAVATLHFALWKALDRVDGVSSRDADVALRWLADLPRHLDRLDHLV